MFVQYLFNYLNKHDNTICIGGTTDFYTISKRIKYFYSATN